MRLSLSRKRNAPPRIASSLPRLPGLEFVGVILDRVVATAQVGLAYGEPITVGDRTIIPVGAVGYGFGVGVGGGRGPGRRQRGGGGGGGGGVNVQPVALIEISRKGTRIRPVLDWTRIIVMAIGIVTPLFLRWRRDMRRNALAAE